MFKSSTLLSLTFVAGLVAAQSLSDSCQNALSGIVTNADTANCLNPSALISIALNGGNTSVIQPIDTWLTGLCAQAPCTNATLEATTRSILSGCSTDFGSFGLNVNDDSTASSVVATVQQYYPTVRKVVCLKDSDKLCVTETLTTVESLVGPLTVNNVPSILGTIMSQTQVPTNISCTSCAKEAFNIIKQDVPSAADAINRDLGAQCGAAFVDGNTPSGISQSASTASPGTNAANNGALGVVPMPSLGASLTMIGSAAFALLM